MNTNALSTRAAPQAPAASFPKTTRAAGMNNSLIAAMTPNSIEDAFRLSKALSQSGDMIPKHFQGKPEAIMAAMLQGASLGLPPMQALQFIAVINGRPCVWGDALPAMVMAAGHFIDQEIEGKGKDRVAVATLTRKDGKKIVRRFSFADAEQAGLTKKTGPWQQYPERMLAMRARAFAIRDGAPDVLLGLAIADEVQDYGPDRAVDVTPRAPRAGRPMYLDPTPAAALPEPDADEVVEMSISAADPQLGESGNEDFTPSTDGMTPEQRAEMEAAEADFRNGA